MIIKIIFITLLSLVAASCSSVVKIAALPLVVPFDIIHNTSKGRRPDILLSKKELDKRRRKDQLELTNRYKSNTKMIRDELKMRLNESGQQPNFIVEAPSLVRQSIISYIKKELDGDVRDTLRKTPFLPQYKITAKPVRIETNEIALEIRMYDLDDNKLLFMTDYNTHSLARDINNFDPNERAFDLYSRHKGMFDAMHSFKRPK